ncbi:DUF2190 family protein [Leeia aquatica]|uniref:DUF2190 family protein n=1 Tax=Leeia aquatica TaxID=2725557 RepID=A0A847S330_9NEIS|nr:DUF2190 family protein [Leeia aquatica]NLR73577.1 DUF2190 family protein [Leeia aquatica]
MKTQQSILTTSVITSAGLTRRRFVGFDGNACGTGVKALGVVDADTEAGGVAPANVLGLILVEAGAAIAVGAEVQSDANGKAIPKAAGVGNGIALDAAAAAGDVIRIVRGI